jgi:hypothetical protein
MRGNHVAKAENGLMPQFGNALALVTFASASLSLEEGMNGNLSGRDAARHPRPSLMPPWREGSRWSSA